MSGPFRRASICGELCRFHAHRIRGLEQRCTKRVPLCRLVDPRLTELVPGLRLVEYEARAKSIHRGHRSAEKLLRERDILRMTSPEWVDTIREAHKRMFARALPLHAGRYRTEDVYFGHCGHERRGLAPDELESAFARFCQRMFVDEWSRCEGGVAGFSEWAARFFVRFFDVHPFADGNGRIARIVVSRVAQATTGHALGVRNDARSRKRYRESLQYARQRNHAESYGPLANWVRRSLRQMQEDEIGEHPHRPSEETDPDASD